MLMVGCTYAIVQFSLHPLIKLGLSLVIAHCFACWGFIGHEILHGSVVRTVWLRDLLGGLCMAPFNVGPMLWRWWHNVEHHGNTQRPHDPDAYSTLEEYNRRPELRFLLRIAPMRSLLFFPLFCLWFTVHSFCMLCRAQKRVSPRERAQFIAQYVAPVLFWLSLGVWLGWSNWVFFYLIPLLLGNFVVISYIATNHLLNPLLHTEDPIAGSLTVTTWRLVDILHMNFSYHTEHHIFPAMNPKYAPQVKALLKRFWPDKYQEMSHCQAMLTLWRTPRLYLDEIFLVDPDSKAIYGTLGNGLDPQQVAPTGRLSS
jgi:fatty acid desaturase